MNLKMSALALTSLLAAGGFAQAQQLVLVVPAPMPQVITPMPDPTVMFQQMDALMQANMSQMMTMPQMPAGASGEVVVTSFSDGTHSCTEQVVYPANGGAAKIQVSESGNACSTLSAPGIVPAAAPLRPAPIPVTGPSLGHGPALVVADNN